jgi:hypothetical protein
MQHDLAKNMFKWYCFAADHGSPVVIATRANESVVVSDGFGISPVFKPTMLIRVDCRIPPSLSNWAGIALIILGHVSRCRTDFFATMLLSRLSAVGIARCCHRAGNHSAISAMSRAVADGCDKNGE